MKKLIPIILLLTLLLPCRAQFACSGLDRVDIYLNNKLVATATPFNAPTIKPGTLSKTDTLLFHAFTNWEGLRNSTMDVKDESGELIDHINSRNNNGYEAIFTYVFDSSTMDDPDVKSIDVSINLLCERDVVPEQICTVSLNAVNH